MILEIIDSNWSRHLEIMDVLKEEAGLFSYASQDPLVDYILESKKCLNKWGRDTTTISSNSIWENKQELRRVGMTDIKF